MGPADQVVGATCRLLTRCQSGLGSFWMEEEEGVHIRKPWLPRRLCEQNRDGNCHFSTSLSPRALGMS